MRNTAIAITKEEWKEISLCPAVLKMFDTEDILADDLAASVYGAKFILPMHDAAEDVILYTLVDMTTVGNVVLVLERANGVLQEMGK